MAETPELTPRRLLQRWSRYARRWIIGAAAGGTLHGVLVIVQAGLIAALVQRVVIDGLAPTALAALVAVLAATVTLRALVRWGQLRCATEAGLRVRQRVRAEVVDHLARLGPQAIHHLHSAGLASRAVEQVEALEGYFARYLPQLWLTVAVPVAILATVATLDWLAAIFLLLSAPLIPLFMALVGMGAERLQQRHFESMTRLAGHFLDRVRGLSTLQLFGYAPHSVDEVEAAAEGYRQRAMATLRVAFLSSAVLEFFASVAIAVVAIYIGFGLLGYIAFGPADELTLFSGLFILLLAPEFFQPLRSLAQHYHDRAAALGAAAQLNDVLALESPSPLASVAEDGVPGTVAVDGLELAYPGRGVILGPVSLEVGAGEVVVLAGPSGSGKSSLLRAVAGFQGLAGGAVQRGPGAVAWVGQQPFITQESIRENIRLGRPEADDAAVEAAAADAAVAGFARLLPQGLDTVIGERGHGLSGGQAQRVALARVFLSDAPLVLLDEPTTGLDTQSEAVVLHALLNLAGSGRSLLIASHHASVLAMADRVVDLGGPSPREMGA
ncbi:thiol reductant ABC exporter subunit CydD [Ectothiorhodospiraceae bacterium WFHF3C12]|nr:thiol reductant ABC exporter subunit CydD [Ectothiorhodospiraceae bacterium WFHF3C12]